AGHGRDAAASELGPQRVGVAPAGVRLAHGAAAEDGHDRLAVRGAGHEAAPGWDKPWEEASCHMPGKETPGGRGPRSGTPGGTGNCRDPRLRRGHLGRCGPMDRAESTQNPVWSAEPELARLMGPLWS